MQIRREEGCIQEKMVFLPCNNLHPRIIPHHFLAASYSVIHPILLTAVITVLLLGQHHADAYTFVYAGCSPSRADPGSPFQSSLNALLAAIAASASQASYASFSNGTATPVYGLFQCRADLSVADCSSCVQSAVGQLALVCPSAYSAALQLDGCLVRYSSDDFLGRLDTAVVYRRCSPSTSNDGEFFRRRDDVLADLQAGTGFRVSSYGAVQGVAQCLGDLNGADCSSCLAAAVGALKNACGSAMSSDVYLGQCYARYWASGYYPRSDSDASDDDVGKTVAIIVGILAALALVVVFLSFLRKALA